MNQLTKFLFLLEAVFLFLKSFDFLYLFQTKEYRFDRLRSHFFEEGIFKVLFLRGLRFPAKSLRNFLSTLIIFVLTWVFYFAIPSPNIILLLIFLLTLPIASLVIVSLSVLLTSIPVRIYRRSKIKQAARLIEKSKAIFIGITGSYGKTTTKEFLYQILSQKFQVAKTDKNKNTDVGVALAVLSNLKPQTEIFIAEMGAYRVGEIATICKFVKPTYGILTGIGNQHLDLFGSRQNIIKAKSELLQALPENGKAYINKDIENYQSLTQNLKCPVYFYSTQSSSNVFTQKIKTRILAKHHLTNLLPCIALATDLRLTEEQITQAIQSLNLPDKLVMSKGTNESSIIKDSNNSNVEGFIAAIQMTNELPQKKKIIVSRGIIELGREKRTSYQQILSNLNKSNALLYTTDKLFKELDTDNKVFFYKNESSLKQALINQLNKETLVIIEGRFSPHFVLK